MILKQALHDVAKLKSKKVYKLTCVCTASVRLSTGECINVGSCSDDADEALVEETNASCNCCGGRQRCSRKLWQLSWSAGSFVIVLKLQLVSVA